MTQPTDADARFVAGETVSVSSSNVAWLRYDADASTLYVGYKNGGEYYRDGVDLETALATRNAGSVGKALHALAQTLGKFTKC